MPYDMESIQRIRHSTGYYYEVRPDRDLLYGVEIRYFDDKKATLPRQAISLTEDSIPMLIKALEAQLVQIQEAKDREAS